MDEEQENRETPNEEQAGGQVTAEQYQALIDRMTALEADNTTLKGKLKEANGESAGRRRKIQTAEEQQAELVSENERLEGELATARETISTMEGRLKVYTDRDETERVAVLESLPADKRETFKNLPADQLRVIAAALGAAAGDQQEEAPVVKQQSQGARGASTATTKEKAIDPLAMVDAAVESGDVAAINKAFEEYSKKGR